MNETLQPQGTTGDETLADRNQELRDKLRKSGIEILFPHLDPDSNEARNIMLLLAANADMPLSDELVREIQNMLGVDYPTSPPSTDTGEILA